MKKRMICAVLAAIMMIMCASCGKGDNAGQASGTSTQTETSVLPTVLNTTEYMLYQNIFYNQQGNQYVGQKVTKTGTFVRLIDRYTEMERYYVWGYNDQTKCCDWQWEIMPKDTSSLPSNGSLVEVVGVFASDSVALDGYLINNATITVKTKYNGPDCDVDMTAMGGTLERVEIVNMVNHADWFEGKTVRAYGRIFSPTSIQHPYYDSAFELSFESTDTLPAIGTEVIISGTFEDGVVKNATVEVTDMY